MLARSTLVALLVALPLAGASAQIRPGEWRTTVRMTAINMPGIPKDMQKQMLAQPMTVSDCVTAEDVKEGAKALLDTADDDEDGSCSYSKFTLAGGRIDTVAVCKRRTGKTAVTTTIVTQGSYTPTRMIAKSTSTGSDGSRMQAEIQSSRVGACAR